MKTTGFQKNLFLPEMEKIYCLCCFHLSRTPDWVTTVKESFVPHFAQLVVHTEKEALFCKLKLGPQEMSGLRPENMPAVSFSLVGKCSSLYKNQQNAHFFPLMI